MIERLEEIARIENVNPNEFDLTGTKMFIEEHKTKPECRFELSSSYDGDILWNISLGVFYKNPDLFVHF